ncbi:hypothetical protein VT930_11800 [Mycobacterium sherrisii]|uniref:hypothetical protein n=1 Tax=Mycobacterium sherrisii TaxID=243061 RepID=UPI002DDDBA9A|nr:hypothetical protein [Mycobacterium sherrisii]MEC4763787.1 hypothetical protein [Mycobacterium sherrisii]
MNGWEGQRDSVRIAAEITLKANSAAVAEPGGMMLLPVEEWLRVNRMADAIRRAATEQPDRPIVPRPHAKVRPPNLIHLRNERKTS